jgi:hypothetical protein
MRALPNVRLHFIELAHGDRPFDLTRPHLHHDDLQVRSNTVMFHKENLLNLAVQRFPSGWQYGAIVDADFHFSRHDWALAVVHQLQTHPWVQPFSSYTNLSGTATPGTGCAPVSTNYGFAYNYVRNGYRLPPGWKEGDAYAQRKGVGATGGAWAFTREGWDTVGGLMDRCVLGSGDWFMAFGLIDERAPDKRYDLYTTDYADYIEAWRTHARRIRKDIGYVDCHATHGWHGSMRQRGYGSRDEILIRHAFEPTLDLRPDWQGVLQLNPDKPGLRDDIRAYFLSRNEDDPTL